MMMVLFLGPHGAQSPLMEALWSSLSWGAAGGGTLLVPLNLLLLRPVMVVEARKAIITPKSPPWGGPVGRA